MGRFHFLITNMSCMQCSDMRPSGLTFIPCRQCSGCWSIHSVQYAGVSLYLGRLRWASSSWWACQLSGCRGGWLGKWGSRQSGTLGVGHSAILHTADSNHTGYIQSFNVCWWALVCCLVCVFCAWDTKPFTWQTVPLLPFLQVALKRCSHSLTIEGKPWSVGNMVLCGRQLRPHSVVLPLLLLPCGQCCPLGSSGHPWG